MVSDKNEILGYANSFIKKVSAAKSACESAVSNMVYPMSDISSNWHGDSGKAMYESLDELRMELIRIQVRLDALETTMNSEARTIYNNWVDTN